MVIKNMKKYLMILLIGATIFTLTTTITAEPTRIEKKNKELENEDLITVTIQKSEEKLIPYDLNSNIQPVIKEESKKELIIAPMTCKDLEEKNIDENENMVVTGLALGGTGPDIKSSECGLGTQVILVTGAVVFLLFALIVLRKK